MKRIKILFALLVVMLVFADSSIAHASEDDVIVTARELKVRQLSQKEMEGVIREVSTEDVVDGVMMPMATTASYTAYEYSRAFDFHMNGRWVAQADAKCIVWHYTDGKVHLYNRTITVERLASYDAGRTYGRIVNTDGSLSYTTGDRVHLYSITNSWDFAIDFRVTPTEASFNCYEV